MTKKVSIELTIHNHYHKFITSPEVLPAFRSPWTQKGKADRLGEYMVAVHGILPIPREYREELPGVVHNTHIDHLDFLLGPSECDELTEIGISIGGWLAIRHNRTPKYLRVSSCFGNT